VKSGPANSTPGLVEEPGQNIKQRAELLDQTRWVNEFSWPEIETLAFYMQIQKAVKDVYICHEGSEDNAMFIIAKGSVSILKEGANKKQKVIASLGPGQTLGEMSLLDGEPRSASARAASDLVLLTLSKPGLEMLIREKPALAVKFVIKLARQMSQRLRMTSGVLVDHLR
jgi:CRP/FNR family cyclic AMP-dependent transcriptional regulator